MFQCCFSLTLLLFPPFIVLTGTSRKMLNPCLTLDFNGNVSNISLLSMLLAIGFLYILFFQETFLLLLDYSSFSWEWVLKVIKGLFYVYWDDLMGGNTVNYIKSFLMMKPPWIPEVCLHWLWLSVDISTAWTWKEWRRKFFFSSCLGKCIPRDTKEQSSITLPGQRISVLLIPPAPSPGVKLNTV